MTPTSRELLARAVRLLSPPHLVVVAGVQSGEIGALARAEARGLAGSVDRAGRSRA